ncbi:MAG: [Fe-Fe] hydrogenase large subunit C-terminal domain-containing protein [Eubacteriales bacterium]|nr:[Fe-Fe] hydrogenase large subunit C-terminal domain-containing protein [Eubacteriales bacterium]
MTEEKKKQGKVEYLQLKKSNCKNCYKCIRHCPVKSIRFSGNQAHIVSDECILCGQCFVVCPQDAKVISEEIEKAKVLIQSGDPVVVSLAPSFAANYEGIGITAMERALKALGFAAAEETAIGATLVKKEYERMVGEGTRDIIITSCCHSVNLMIQKYFPEALTYLADVVTPMQAHCKDIKRRIPNAKTVFIGPCISKKAETEVSDAVDCVLTFEELTKWFKAEKVWPENTPDEVAGGRARFFPTGGGIIKSMTCDWNGYQTLTVDGTENCIRALKDIAAGRIDHCFIEMSACAGSCVGGPVMDKNRTSPVRDYLAVANYVTQADFPVEMPAPEQLRRAHEYLDIRKPIPSQSDIEDVLRRMGKTKPEDELNCGSCGYDTCREKAAAVLQGKADLTMCLPYLKDKAETFSDTIINNTPNGILVLNEMLEVQQINRAALKLFNLRDPSDVLGTPLVRLLDPAVFLKVRDSGESVQNQRVYLAEYKRYVEQTILYERSYRALLCIMRDVTEEESQREKREELRRKTVDTTDRVIEKQMCVVQEIASLLGETTAQTQIALTKLKESLNDE